jgi:hypothetical protein
VREDYRTIPVEVLRDFARTWAAATTIRRAAAECGLSHTALNNFILGRTMPQPRTRRTLALWYLERRGDVNDTDAARPYAEAVSTLVSALAEPDREAASAFLVEALEAIYAVQRPRWLELLKS